MRHRNDNGAVEFMASAETASPIGKKLQELVGILARGRHNHHKPLFTQGSEAQWSDSAWTTLQGALATFDSERLTQMVLWGHRECIRVQLDPQSNSALRLLISSRARGGLMHERHPDIQTAITNFNKAYYNEFT